jgi:hypothetical protein
MALYLAHTEPTTRSSPHQHHAARGRDAGAARSSSHHHPVVNFSVPGQPAKQRNEVRETRPETIVISV